MRGRRESERKSAAPADAAIDDSAVLAEAAAACISGSSLPAWHRGWLQPQPPPLPLPLPSSLLLPPSLLLLQMLHSLCSASPTNVHVAVSPCGSAFVNARSVKVFATVNGVGVLPVGVMTSFATAAVQTPTATFTRMHVTVDMLLIGIFLGSIDDRMIES